MPLKSLYSMHYIPFKRLNAIYPIHYTQSTTLSWYHKFRVLILGRGFHCLRRTAPGEIDLRQGQRLGRKVLAVDLIDSLP